MFADGIVEDIITGLSRIKWLFVIARNSSFTYRGKAVDVKQVGRELGVRYLLEGGVRKAGNRIRITAQLVDAETCSHLWAERYDRLLDDIFAVQDELTVSVVGAIEQSLRKAEIEHIKRERPNGLRWVRSRVGLCRSFTLRCRRRRDRYSAAREGVGTRARLCARAADLAWCLRHRFSRRQRHEEDRAAARVTPTRRLPGAATMQPRWR